MGVFSIGFDCTLPNLHLNHIVIRCAGKKINFRMLQKIIWLGWQAEPNRRYVNLMAFYSHFTRNASSAIIVSYSALLMLHRDIITIK